MEKNIKHPILIVNTLFLICMFGRFFEYFILETDKSILGENLFHKIFGIFIIWISLKFLHLKYKDIGFTNKNILSNFIKGLLLATICFTISYFIEMFILYLQGNTPHLELYISSFQLTGTEIKNTGFLFFLSCILFNIINVFMEEGLFRGLFIKILSHKTTFFYANLLSALLFGLWHFVMPFKSYITGEMSFLQMILMSIGYIILSGLMSIKWGLLYKISNNLWIGLSDHLFNNAVATNMLHVVTNTGNDEMQIIRIIIAQLISFFIVLFIYNKKNIS